jgi:hypothetical protein
MSKKLSCYYGNSFIKKVLLLCLMLFPILSFSLEYRLGDQELLLMPTAYTMTRHKIYVQSYQVIFGNYAYAIGNNTHLAAASLPPVIIPWIETAVLGIKHNYLRNQSWHSAVYGSYMPKTDSFLLGNVVSIGKEPGKSFHLGLTYFSFGHDTSDYREKFGNWCLSAGYRYDHSEKTTFLAEYSLTNGLDSSGNPRGILLAGVRKQTSPTTSWEIAGFRLNQGMGVWLAYPLLKVSFYFR